MKGAGLRNTITGELLPVVTFPTCPNGCPCDEYQTRNGKPYCPYCKKYCKGTLEYAAPPAPYMVDGDGWYYRPIRSDEDPETLDANTPGHLGFVSEDRTRLYIRGIEYDPNPAVPFEKLGFPKYEDLHG
jgi:hypothetical protein